MMLPMALTVTSDAYVALQRVGKAFLAEELDDELQVDLSAPDAIRATYVPQNSLLPYPKPPKVLY